MNTYSGQAANSDLAVMGSNLPSSGVYDNHDDKYNTVWLAVHEEHTLVFKVSQQLSFQTVPL